MKKVSRALQKLSDNLFLYRVYPSFSTGTSFPQTGPQLPVWGRFASVGRGANGFLSSPFSGGMCFLLRTVVVSLRLGHARVLTVPRTVIHCARAASLRLSLQEKHKPLSPHPTKTKQGQVGSWGPICPTEPSVENERSARKNKISGKFLGCGGFFQKGPAKTKSPHKSKKPPQKQKALTKKRDVLNEEITLTE